MNRLFARSIYSALTLALSMLVLAACSTTSDKSQALKSAKVHTELAGLYYELSLIHI